MTISVVAEIWKAVKGNLDHTSVNEAAETVIDILLDHDYDVSEIKQAFKRDKEFLDVLGAYDPPSAEDDDIDYEEEEESEDEDEEDWN